MNNLWLAFKIGAGVIAVDFIIVFCTIGALEGKLREIKVEVALLQQQVIVLLVGQGYQMQEKK